MSTKNLMISASGIRGIVGESLTPQLALDLSQRFGHYLIQKTNNTRIIVGGDTRTSYKMLSEAVVSGLLSVGCDVIDIGKIPTPTAQQMIKYHKASGAIVITASHNPAIWNGLKLMNENAGFLSANEFDTFYSKYQNIDITQKKFNELGSYQKENNAIKIHINYILDRIDTKAIKKANLQVLVDVNNGTGALATPVLLDKLGVNYTLLGPTPNGQFEHTPEPTQENLQSLINTLKEGHYDAGFAQDPDADRLVIVAENGDYIGEDYSLAYCLDYVLGSLEEKTSNKQVAVNLSTSAIIADICKKHNSKIHYSKIGEPNVVEKIKECGAVVGGEGNGGVIYPKIGWGRDSLVGITLALCHLAKRKEKISKTVANYPKWVMLREKMALDSKEDAKPFLELLSKVYKDTKQDTQDGLKLYFNDGWVHIRPSNTEPILRLFAEANSKEQAKKYCECIQDSLKNTELN